MDPWRYLSDGKSLLFSEDLDNLPVDGLVRSKDTSMEWETKPSYGIESYPLPSNSAAVENSGLMELGFHGLAQKSYSSEPSGDMSSDDIGVESLKKLSSVAFNTSNMVAPGEESSGRISSFFLESNRQDSLMFDLKLGGLAESGISKDVQVFREGTSKLSSAASPSPAKRGRSTNQYMQAPFCQVHGCNKDLSSFKDYYKRHKVCEAHTKTAKVIVNGIEQRFCQQCSRFHLIAEFDEGKRSCRKRLADHNERRRKPQLTVGPGSRYLESSVSRGSSSSLPDMLPTDTFGLRKYENGETMRHINFEVPTASLNVVPDNMSSSGPRERMFGMDACGREGVQNPSHALSLLSDSAPNISTQLLRSQSTSQLMTEMNWDHQGADGRASLHSMMNDSEFTDYVEGHHPEGGAMVNLHQLSSHLQRVEQQRNSEQVRPPDTMFGAFPSSER